MIDEYKNLFVGFFGAHYVRDDNRNAGEYKQNAYEYAHAHAAEIQNVVYSYRLDPSTPYSVVYAVSRKDEPVETLVPADIQPKQYAESYQIPNRFVQRYGIMPKSVPAYHAERRPL